MDASGSVARVGFYLAASRHHPRGPGPMGTAAKRASRRTNFPSAQAMARRRPTWQGIVVGRVTGPPRSWWPDGQRSSHGQNEYAVAVQCSDDGPTGGQIAHYRGSTLMRNSYGMWICLAVIAWLLLGPVEDGHASSAPIKVLHPAGHVAAGSPARIDLRVPAAVTSCRLRFKGPARADKVPSQSIPVTGRYVRVTWTIGQTAAAGRWRVSISCGRSARSGQTVILVKGGARARHGRLIKPGTLVASSSNAPFTKPGPTPGGSHTSPGATVPTPASPIPGPSPASGEGETPEQPGPPAANAGTFDGHQSGLGAGQEAGPLTALYSSSQRYRLVMQNDGNLVLYTQNNRALWNSQTAGHPGARAVMQQDGNLVVYDTADHALWDAHTGGHPGSGLVVQDDGNVVIYDGSTALWSTGTVQTGLAASDTLKAGQAVSSPNGRFQLVMQTDGNLVLYTPTGRAIWNTKTAGHPGAYAVMQGDGNAVVYDSSNSPLWNAGTSGHPGSYLAVQDDGNVAVYEGATARWASGSVDGRLESGERLNAGQKLYSPSEAFYVAMQGDGNLVLYRSSGGALWNSQTAGRPGAYAIMQPDGNLVVYDAGGGTALWNSGTAGHPGSYFVIQDDGNGVIYAGSTYTFATNTAAGSSIGSTGAGSAIAEAAAAGAEARLGQIYTSENPNAGWWSGYCETFAWIVYGRRARYPSAIADYNDRAAHGLIHGGAPPRGALVFYGGGTYGHITIGVGGGQVTGTLGYANDRLPISRKAYTYFSNYLGWATPY